jgi:hypothetical protein
MSRESPERHAHRQVCVSYLFAVLFTTNQAPPFQIFSKYPDIQADIWGQIFWDNMARNITLQ